MPPFGALHGTHLATQGAHQAQRAQACPGGWAALRSSKVSLLQAHRRSVAGLGAWVRRPHFRGSPSTFGGPLMIPLSGGSSLAGAAGAVSPLPPRHRGHLAPQALVPGQGGHNLGDPLLNLGVPLGGPPEWGQLPGWSRRSRELAAAAAPQASCAAGLGAWAGSPCVGGP